MVVIRYLMNKVLLKFLGFFCLCSPNWYYYNENCYYLSPCQDKVNQSTARAKCRTMGADLVSISDKAEMNFLLNISYELFVFVLKFPNAKRK